MTPETTILIAEDDPGLRTSLSFLLKSKGYGVMAAADGQAALQLMFDKESGQTVADVLITDIQMPRMNGMDLIAEVRQRKMDLPIIVITGHGDKDMLVSLLRLGCDDFLSKPFEPAEVDEKVRDVLEKKRRERSARAMEQVDFMADRAQLEAEMATYRRSYENLRKEVEAAVGSYRGLIHFNREGYRVPFAFRDRPMRDLGGDYLGICDSEKGASVLVADVAGHDMSASYHTVLVKAFFDEHCRKRQDGAGLFELLNQGLYDEGTNDRMVTAAHLDIDLDAMRCTVVSAGHPRCLMVREGTGEVARIDAGGTVLGVSDELDLSPVALDISPGDRLFLYTDGLSNAQRVDGATGVARTLGEEGLARLLADNAELSLEEHVGLVWEGVFLFTRQRQFDDMLLVGVEIPSG